MPTNEPEVIGRNQLVLPPSPHGWKCKDCPAYLAALEYSAYVLPSGQCIPEQLARQEMPVTALASCKKTRESFCTAGPAWVRVAYDHWCWNFTRIRDMANNF